jgi:hypothetical protein
MRYWKSRFLLFTFLSLVLNSTAFADKPATQCSYSIDLGSDRVFVMFAVDQTQDCLSQGKEKLAAAAALRSKYRSSGLYRLESPEPVWTVDWFAFKVFLSTDGKYVVRSGPWASSITNEAFSFFADGKLLRSYTVNDVVRYSFALPHSASHFEWEKTSGLNEAEKTFEVTTLEGGQFKFSLETGEMLIKHFPLLPPTTGLAGPDSIFSNWYFLGGAAVLFVLVLFLAIRTFNRKLNKAKGL